MSASSAVTSSNGVSPWHALHDHKKGSSDGSSSDEPWSDSALWASPTASGSATSSDSTDPSSTNGVSSAVEQLIAGLQSFLVNLQSADSTTTSDAGGVTAADATTAATAAGSTATTSTDPGSFDLSSILADLQDASAAGPSAPASCDPSAYAGTSDQPATDAMASTSTGTGSNQPQSLADILNALQSYTAPFNPAAAAATTSLTA